MPEENSQNSSKTGVNLTKSLIAQRNLFIPVGKETPENISKALTSLSILRLDRERISCIANLQGFQQIHSIYLQENQIEKIENLSCLPNLKFLSLAGNHIHRVENLQGLQKLQFLDLSENRIKTLDTDELPQSLLVLNLTGNKCTDQSRYRQCVLEALPHLIELDAQHIPSQKASVQDREKEEEDSEDSDYDDIPELSHPLTAEKDFFADLHEEFASRCTWRRGEAVNEHEDRLKELDERQKLRGLPFERSQGSPSARISNSEHVTSTLEDTMLQTEHHVASSPLLKTAPPTCPVGARASKERPEGSGSRTKLKTLKGEAPVVSQRTQEIPK
ncbi:leucine-rich repeat-containing protein 46 [Tiliqua scincoides]|uniref:leucine-rich repeat-containing protein 46 n=1 Tax=Tiliqua scincoides TaxID=71010 RepID=UPI003462A18A